MPMLDISDDGLVPMSPSAVAAAPGGPCALARWVPGLGLALLADRGDEGRLWRARALTPVREGVVAWHGTAEIWLEAWHDATVVHLYVRLDPDVADEEHPLKQPSRGDCGRLRGQLVDRWRGRLHVWRRDVTGKRVPGAAVPVAGA